jgi:hypothetical protein
MGEFLSFFDGLRMTKVKVLVTPRLGSVWQVESFRYNYTSSVWQWENFCHSSTGSEWQRKKYSSQLYTLGVTIGEFLSFFDGLRMTKVKVLVTPRLGSVWQVEVFVTTIHARCDNGRIFVILRRVQNDKGKSIRHNYTRSVWQWENFCHSSTGSEWQRKKFSSHFDRAQCDNRNNCLWSYKA